MSSKLAKLGDDFMKVPKLEASGVNWVVYKDRFVWSIVIGTGNLWVF